MADGRHLEKPKNGHKNDSSLFDALAFRKELEYRNSNFKTFNFDDLAT